MRRREAPAALLCAVALVAFALNGCARPSGEAQAATYGLGRAPSSAELAQIDIDVSPDGSGLPSGQGTAGEGAPLFAERCSRCHGAAIALDPMRWPYATTLFDYIRRAMPPDAPRRLTDREVYAITAFALAANGITARGDVMEKETLPRVAMPNRSAFVDSR